MSDFGLDFRLVVDSNGVLDADIFNICDGTPEAILPSDYSFVMGNQGDYWWEPCQLDGSNIRTFKGRFILQRELDNSAALIDQASLGDERVLGSTTVITLEDGGVVTVDREIILQDGTNLSLSTTTTSSGTTATIGG